MCQKLLAKYRDELMACARISDFTDKEKAQNFENVCKLSTRMVLFRNGVKPTPDNSHKNSLAYISNALDAMAEFQRMHDVSAADFKVTYLSLNILTKQIRDTERDFFQEHCLGMEPESSEVLSSDIITVKTKIKKRETTLASLTEELHKSILLKKDDKDIHRLKNEINDLNNLINESESTLISHEKKIEHSKKNKLKTYQHLFEKQSQQLIDKTVKEMIRSMTRIDSLDRLSRSKSARINLAKSVYQHTPPAKKVKTDRLLFQILNATQRQHTTEDLTRRIHDILKANQVTENKKEVDKKRQESKPPVITTQNSEFETKEVLIPEPILPIENSFEVHTDSVTETTPNSSAFDCVAGSSILLIDETVVPDFNITDDSILTEIEVTEKPESKLATQPELPAEDCIETNKKTDKKITFDVSETDRSKSDNNSSVASVIRRVSSKRVNSDYRKSIQKFLERDNLQSVSNLINKWNKE